MELDSGDKVHIVTRRVFEEDLRRHFVGEILSLDTALAIVKGYSYILNPNQNIFEKIPAIRTRVFDLSSALLIVNIIPNETNIESIVYKTDSSGRMILTDKQEFSLDVNEFGINR